VTPEELDRGRAVIRRWPHEERVSVTRMFEREARLIVLAAALLDIAPGTPPGKDPELLIDLRRPR
jgi:hypothetical protein